MKRIKIVCAMFLSFVILGSAIVYGETITKSIQVTYRNISIQVNGKIVPSEQEPFIYQGRTFVPLRTIGEAVNKTVEWDNAKNQIKISDPVPTHVRLDSIQSFISYLPDQCKMTETDEKLTEEEIDKIQKFNDDIFKRLGEEGKAPKVRGDGDYFKSYKIERLGDVITLFYNLHKTKDDLGNTRIYAAFPCIKYKDGSLYFLSISNFNNNWICGSSDGWYTDKYFSTSSQNSGDRLYFEYLAKVNNSIMFDKPNRSQQITDLYAICYWFRNSNLFTVD